MTPMGQIVQIIDTDALFLFSFGQVVSKSPRSSLGSGEAEAQVVDEHAGHGQECSLARGRFNSCLYFVLTRRGRPLFGVRAWCVGVLGKGGSRYDTLLGIGIMRHTEGGRADGRTDGRMDVWTDGKDCTAFT